MIATAAAATADDELVFSRLATCPRDKLFAAGPSQRESLNGSRRPHGRAVSAEIDLRPGGAGQVTIQGPDGA
jgi:uncharacterized protein YndB with AHSA1/START domain